MLLLLFIAEVILSSLAFVFPTTLSHFVKDRLSKDLITLYREDTNLQNLIDIIQMEFKCCGVTDNGFKDWSMNIYFNCSVSNPSSERCAVPFSCCRDFNVSNQHVRLSKTTVKLFLFFNHLQTGLINIMCGYNMQNLSSVVEVNKYVFTRGCLEAISELVERNMNLVAGICLGSALAQVSDYWLMGTERGDDDVKTDKTIMSICQRTSEWFPKISSMRYNTLFSFSSFTPLYLAYWHGWLWTRFGLIPSNILPYLWHFRVTHCHRIQIIAPFCRHSCFKSAVCDVFSTLLARADLWATCAMDVKNDYFTCLYKIECKKLLNLLIVCKCISLPLNNDFFISFHWVFYFLNYTIIWKLPSSETWGFT